LHFLIGIPGMPYINVIATPGMPYIGTPGMPYINVIGVINWP
jgi:hypothetical protein